MTAVETSEGTDSGAETATENAIVVEGLTKEFDGLVAVDDVSFSVRRGEIFGFLGPNGAGKTTTIKAMLGLLHPGAGIVTINGADVFEDGKAAKDDLGVLPERMSFYDNLTPVQTLRFFAQLKDVEIDPRELLEEVGLDHAAERKVGTFSKGMTQLLGVAQAMIGAPSVYVFDEPMSGLDPRWTRRVREKIRALNAKGATVFLSSHNLAEVQVLCDRVSIIDGGELIATDTVSALSEDALVKPRLELVVPGLEGEVPAVLDDLEGVDSATVEGDVLTVTSNPERRATIVAALVEAGVEILDVQARQPSLEDVFVELVEESEEAGAR